MIFVSRCNWLLSDMSSRLGVDLTAGMMLVSVLISQSGLQALVLHNQNASNVAGRGHSNSNVRV